MADRYTRKDAERAMGRLLDAIGGRWAASYQDVGGYQLDYNPTYGGCTIERIVNENGAITQPFGYTRRSPREFCDTIQFTLEALREQGAIKAGTTHEAV